MTGTTGTTGTSGTSGASGPRNELTQSFFFHFKACGSCRNCDARPDSPSIESISLACAVQTHTSVGVRRYQDLIAWQVSEAFRAEVYRLVLASQEARGDLRYRHQVLEAADGVGANIAEGFIRYSPADFCRFLDYALASLIEAERRLLNGISRQYIADSSSTAALRLARRATSAIIKLKRSQRRNWRPPGKERS